MTEACQFLHTDSWILLVDAQKDSNDMFKRIQYIGHILMSIGRGISINSCRVPELPFPESILSYKCYTGHMLVSHTFDKSETPRNGQYKNQFTRVNAQPRRIDRTSRSRP